MASAETVRAHEMMRALGSALGARRRALVIGGYGCGNLGDEAILSVMLGDLHSIGVSPRVISVRAAETRRVHGVRAYPASPAGTLLGLLETNALIIGGGGIFSAYMGPRSRRLPDLARMAALLRHAVAFRAMGVYASTPSDVARTLVEAMERADFVSVRDETSIDALRRFGLRREVILEDDPALRLPADARGPSTSNRIGLAVRRVRDGATQARLEREFVVLLDRLQERAFVPVLLPFSRHPTEWVEQDHAYARELRSRCAWPDGVVIEECDHPREMLRRVASLDALVAMRFHALVFARVSGTRAVAIPYDDKCHSFLARAAVETPAIEPAQLTAEALLGHLAVAEREQVA